MRFRSTFQRLVAQTEYTHALEKCFENAFGDVGSVFQNLRLGGVKSSFGWGKILKMHIAHLDRFGWSMCKIRVCISWPDKSQDAYRTSRPIQCQPVGRDVRDLGLHFFGHTNHKMHIKMHITHSSDQKLHIFIREYLNLGKLSRFHLNHLDYEK